MIQDLPNEIWKDINGWEGYYQISNMGRVKALAKKWGCGHRGETTRFIGDRIRKVCHAGDGYGRVILIADKKRETWLIHRLVAVYFMPNPDGKLEVNHKNGVKTDNRTENLEWSTASENMQHAHRTGIKKPLFGKDNPSSKTVLNLETGIFYESAKEAFSTTNYKKYQTFVSKLNGREFNNTSMVYV